MDRTVLPRRRPSAQPAGRQPAGNALPAKPASKTIDDQAVPWLCPLATLASAWLLQFKVNLNSDIDEQRLDEAATALEHALAENPRLWPACQELAVARAVQGDREATLRTVDRCRAIFPDLQLDVDQLLQRGAAAAPRRGGAG